MIRKKLGELEWLEFEIFEEYKLLVHGIFLRHGGVSAGSLGTLNAGGRMPDEMQNIKENHRRMLEALGIERYSYGKQVHGNEIVWVQKEAQEIQECDGMITHMKDHALMIRHADCQAAIFYDPIQNLLATVHSGWRGQVQNIYGETIKKMTQLFHSKPENILVGISPSLGPEYSEFIHYKTEFPEEFWQFQVKPFYFDLWAIARHQLDQSGILPSHLQIANICTYSNEQDYFSYRRDKQTGNHALFAMNLSQKIDRNFLRE